MKRLLLLAVFGLWVGAAGAQEMFYVIKVTPSLVYLDVGAAAGVQPGDRYLILSEDGKATPYAPVAEVAIVRVAVGFSIAEILSQVEGKQLEVLQRAISAKDWELMAPPVEERKPAQVQTPPPEEVPLPEPEPTTAVRTAPWSILVVGGGEWRKGFALYREHNLPAARRIADQGVGVRLARTWSDRYRLNLGFRLAGKTMGTADADVGQLGLEADLHYLFRGAGLSGPYLGAGASMHRLSWDSPAGGSTYKTGFELAAGVQFPLGRGAWTLLFESGYQRVLKYDDWIDASNVRTYAGLGRNW